mmetsp:Transcript_4538/g.9153  ORF Transcript_4538/g.9153 Transcript_4538/m.9153 type:complete len:106 (-) Transcript_4538:83-400(-)
MKDRRLSSRGAVSTESSLLGLRRRKGPSRGGARDLLVCFAEQHMDDIITLLQSIMDRSLLFLRGSFPLSRSLRSIVLKNESLRQHRILENGYHTFSFWPLPRVVA